MYENRPTNINGSLKKNKNKKNYGLKGKKIDQSHHWFPYLFRPTINGFVLVKGYVSSTAHRHEGSTDALVKIHFPFAEDMELPRSCCSCWASLFSSSVGVLSVRSAGKESRDPYTKSLNSEFLIETWSVRATLIWMSVCIQNLFSGTTLYGVMRMVDV